jgi:uncharacterized protein YicC (UPF0701 family)
MRFPDALKIEKEELDENEWELVFGKVKEALVQITEFRKQEGKALQKDILDRLKLIRSLLKEINTLKLTA